MKYSVCLLLFVYSYSYGMLEVCSPPLFFFQYRDQRNQRSHRQHKPLNMNCHCNLIQRMKIADDKERRDAKFFIACLDGLRCCGKNIRKYKDGYAKLSDREVAFFKFCIEINDITRYKVDDKIRCAVYKQLCSLYLSTPTVNMPALRLWRTLLKKIDQPLFDEQFEQTKKLHTFINDLITEGLICRYPRSVGEWCIKLRFNFFNLTINT